MHYWTKHVQPTLDRVRSSRASKKPPSFYEGVSGTNARPKKPPPSGHRRHGRREKKRLLFLGGRGLSRGSKQGVANPFGLCSPRLADCVLNFVGFRQLQTRADKSSPGLVLRQNRSAHFLRHGSIDFPINKNDLTQHYFSFNSKSRPKSNHTM